MKMLTKGEETKCNGMDVHIFSCGPSSFEVRHGFTKQGHGRPVVEIKGRLIDVSFERRCDASRWAKRHGAKTITHWYLI